MSPVQVSRENTAEVFENLYGVTNRIELLKKEAIRKLPDGEAVRVKYELKPFDKSFYPNWSDQIFTIDGANKLGVKPYYLLRHEDGSVNPRRFYDEDLQKVKPDIYRVEDIVGQRVFKGRKQLKVKWLGYPDSYNSWVDEKNVIRL